MSTAENYTEIQEYVQKSKFGLLTYVREDLTPISRTMGSFAYDGTALYFSSGKETAKVAEIARNKRVSFFFEHDSQSPGSWKSVLLIGDAELLAPGSKEYDTSIEGLSAKSPRFKDRVAKGDLGSAAIYRIGVAEIEYLDRSRGAGPAQRILVKP